MEATDRPTFHLVYQGGIANLFRDTDGRPRRIIQTDYRTAEATARGILLAGGEVEIWHANVAGDCSLFEWERGTGGPFADEQHPPSANWAEV